MVIEEHTNINTEEMYDSRHWGYSASSFQAMRQLPPAIAA